MSKQETNRRESGKNQKRSWQQTVFIVLSVVLIISWIAALLVTL
jgi:hypothetical protein